MGKIKAGHYVWGMWTVKKESKKGWLAIHCKSTKGNVFNTKRECIEMIIHWVNHQKNRKSYGLESATKGKRNGSIFR